MFPRAKVRVFLDSQAESLEYQANFNNSDHTSNLEKEIERYKDSYREKIGRGRRRRSEGGRDRHIVF